MGLVFAAAIVLSLFAGAFSIGRSSGSNKPMQANEQPDAAADQPAKSDTPVPAPTVVAAKRYTAAPPLTIDPSKRYTATIKTTKGDIQIELYPDQAPQAVNAFVFLAKDGYYNTTPFMQVVADAPRFYALAGDPTRTGLGTPGFSVKKELTSKPFVKGSLGMGGTSEDSNGGQFFISFGDYPALNGKYTIFGQVVSGLDVLDKLSLLDVSKRSATGSGDEIQSVTITES